MRISKLLQTIFFFLLLGTLSIHAQQKKITPLSSLEFKLVRMGFVNVQRSDSTIRVDLKYATTDNFTKIVLYDGLERAYLHPEAAQKLVKAQAILKNIDPELCLLVYDAARPVSVQRKMYDKVKNTPLHAYVANPDRTGLHNYGMAVDLTICDNDGNPLDMGTPFDFFGRAAGINMEAELIKEGKLTARQVKNRKLLRKVMTEAGFLTIRGEWWHFNAVPLHVARSKYELIE